MFRPAAAAIAVSQLLLVGLPRPVFAHAILLASDPPAGAIVPAGPVAFVLRYNSRIDAARSRLTMTAPDGTRQVLDATRAAPDQLRAQATLGPGKWSLRWQVLATDGHVTRGDIALTVAP